MGASESGQQRDVPDGPPRLVKNLKFLPHSPVPIAALARSSRPDLSGSWSPYAVRSSFRRAQPVPLGSVCAAQGWRQHHRSVSWHDWETTWFRPRDPTTTMTTKTNINGRTNQPSLGNPTNSGLAGEYARLTLTQCRTWARWPSRKRHDAPRLRSALGPDYSVAGSEYQYTGCARLRDSCSASMASMGEPACCASVSSLTSLFSASAWLKRRSTNSRDLADAVFCDEVGAPTLPSGARPHLRRPSPR